MAVTRQELKAALADYCRHMAGAEEALNVEVLRPHQRAQRRLHGFQHGPDREILHSRIPRRQDCGGSAGRGRLKADAEEHDLFFGVPLRDVYRVDRRIHDLDPCTEGAAALQTVPRNAARNAQHVAVACYYDVRPHRKLQHRVDDGGRSDAHGTSGA